MPKRSSPVTVPEFTVRSVNEQISVTLEGVKVVLLPVLGILLTLRLPV